jgi:hypothetical protein
MYHFHWHPYIHTYIHTYIHKRQYCVLDLLYPERAHIHPSRSNSHTKPAPAASKETPSVSKSPRTSARAVISAVDVRVRVTAYSSELQSVVKALVESVNTGSLKDATLEEGLSIGLLVVATVCVHVRLFSLGTSKNCTCMFTCLNILVCARGFGVACAQFLRGEHAMYMYVCMLEYLFVGRIYWSEVCRLASVF